eukprot:4310015-Amphidinium_carterae.1
MNKSGKTLVHHVAGAIATTECWKSLIDGYVGHMSGLQLYGRKLKEYTLKANQLDDTKQDLSVLAEMVQVLPSMQMGLRPLACCKLETSLQAAIRRIVKSSQAAIRRIVKSSDAAGGEKSFDVDKLQVVSSILADACSIWADQ